MEARPEARSPEARSPEARSPELVSRERVGLNMRRWNQRLGDGVQFPLFWHLFIMVLVSGVVISLMFALHSSLQQINYLSSSLTALTRSESSVFKAISAIDVKDPYTSTNFFVPRKSKSTSSTGAVIDFIKSVTTSSGSKSSKLTVVDEKHDSPISLENFANMHNFRLAELLTAGIRNVGFRLDEVKKAVERISNHIKRTKEVFRKIRSAKEKKLFISNENYAEYQRTLGEIKILASIQSLVAYTTHFSVSYKRLTGAVGKLLNIIAPMV